MVKKFIKKINYLNNLNILFFIYKKIINLLYKYIMYIYILIYISIYLYYYS